MRAGGCGCGSGRLAGACCSAYLLGDANEASPQAHASADTVRRALLGEAPPLSARFDELVTVADGIERHCGPAAVGADDRLAWVPFARNAAASGSAAAGALEQNAPAVLASGPDALSAAAAYLDDALGGTGPVGLDGWIEACREALAAAASVCVASPLGGVPRGALGAADDFASRFVEALAIPDWAKPAAAEVVARFNIQSGCEDPPAGLVNALTSIPGAGITRNKILEACGALLGAAMTVEQCDACRQNLSPVPVGLEAFIGPAALSQPHVAMAGPFEGDWLSTAISGRYAGATNSWRLFDTGTAVVGGTQNGYQLVAKKGGDPGLAYGWMQGADRTLTCITLRSTEGGQAIQTKRTSCRSCPGNCAIWNEERFIRLPGSIGYVGPGGPPIGPDLPEGAAASGGFPWWILGVAAAGVAAVAANR